MTTRSRTLRSTLVALALAASALLGLTSASATPRQPIVYDALGDSYASGYGVPPYSATCGRSDGAYAVQLDGRMKVDLDDFVACAGATTQTLVTGHQLDALDGDTDLVTLTIGGNDIGWSQAVGACLTGTDNQCRAALTGATANISDLLPNRLDTVYTAVSVHAPHAHVLVTGYPRLFSPEYGGYLAASPAEQRAMNDGADLLNRVIAQAAARHGFGFVDVTKRFDGHGANSTDPWLHGLLLGGALDPAAFHPDAAGYEAYTAAVTAAVRPAAFR